jgi:mannosyltransferase OCH1-like enzyme
MKLEMHSSRNGTPGKIPKLIWHTYKEFPPENSKTLVDSWVKLNPDYTWMFMDDSRCNRFIQDNFSKDFVKMYNALPIPVMKADVWRVAVVYAYGGVYSDMDCRCLKPISTWLNPSDELIVGVEVANGSLLNYIFAAKPRHPALLSVLNTFVELYNSTSFMSKNTQTPVQNFGQHGFSNGVLKYYGVDSHEDMLMGGNSNFYNEIYKVQQDNTKFILRQDNVFSHSVYANTCVRHEVASIFWKSKYTSWRKQQKQLCGV